MRKTIKEILESRLGVDKSAMKASSDLRNDLGADSLDFVEIIMDCEQEYDIVIYDTEASDIRTVEDLEKLVNESKSPKQSLEEAAEVYTNQPETGYTSNPYIAVKQAFKDGAEWAKNNDC